MLHDDPDTALGAIHSVLSSADADLRCTVTQQLMAAAQVEESARALRAFVSRQELDDMPSVCMALALRGSGNEDIARESYPTDRKEQDIEYLCAVHALGAMNNHKDDAEWLKDVLRNGAGDERYCATYYLGLARVQSALPVWASVSDQVDAEWDLRALNASMLVRHGHRLGIQWFGKNAQQRPPRQQPAMAYHLARAVSEIIPLMHRCCDINLGRFV